MVILLDKTDHFKIGRKISYKSQNCKQDPKIMTRKDEEEADEEEEDEEEEDEEEEDDGLTLDDVKDVADTASSVFKAVKAFKDISEDSKPKKGYHETSTPRPPTSSYENKTGIWKKYMLRRRTDKTDVEIKLDRIEDKIDKSSKHQNLKWYIGLGVAVVLGIIGLLII